MMHAQENPQRTPNAVPFLHTSNRSTSAPLAPNTVRPATNGTALTQLDLVPSISDGCKFRQMIWQRGEDGPLANLLASKPDFSVLIVNDSPKARMLLRSVLVSFGISNIRDAEGASEAIAGFRQNVPDLAIVDHDMASVNGIEFMRLIRQGPGSPAPELPVIMMACANDPSRIYDIRNSGVTEILAKPFAPNALARQIVSSIRNARDFIHSDSFHGPDRRRQKRPFGGEDKRASNVVSRTVERDEDIHWI